MPKKLPRLDPEHIAALENWIEDCKADLLKDKFNSYLKGQLSGFELCWELIHGEILDSDNE